MTQPCLAYTISPYSTSRHKRTHTHNTHTPDHAAFPALFVPSSSSSIAAGAAAGVVGADAGAGAGAVAVGADAGAGAGAGAGA